MPDNRNPHPHSNATDSTSLLSESEDLSLEKSKSQRKRDMLALQKLVAELLLLPKERYAAVALNDNLRDAIEQMRNTRSHEGRRRQMQYLGKLMRHLDDNEVGIIRTAIDDWSGSGKAHTALLHRLEQWRAELLADDLALTRLLDEYPQIDAQVFRTMVRNARKEVAQNKPPHHFRDLFRVLKQLLSAK